MASGHERSSGFMSCRMDADGHKHRHWVHWMQAGRPSLEEQRLKPPWSDTATPHSQQREQNCTHCLMAATTQTCSRDGEPRLSHFKLIWSCWRIPEDLTQGLFTEVLGTVGTGESGSRLRRKGSPLCGMSGTCFPSKASVCKAFSSGPTPRTGLFHQICPGI